MLRELIIKNVAVIEKAEISFSDGLNVLTGETGAGKSIIIDSINMILGERTSREFVRYGTGKARVQAVFDINDETSSICDELGFDTEDGSVILTREITSDGRSTARINSLAAPVSALKRVASSLVNIHGQQDNQALLSPAKHIYFLDRYAGCEKLRDEFLLSYKKFIAAQKALAELSAGEKEKAQRADLLNYQINEIESANLADGEDEELVASLKEIQNSEKIASSCGAAYSNLYESQDGDSAYDRLSSAIDELADVADYSDTVKDLLTPLNDALYAVEDAAHSVMEYLRGIEYDEKILDDTMQRLSLIKNLKRKYGSTIREIKSYCDSAKKELQTIINIDSAIEEKESERDEALKEAYSAAAKLSELRRKAAADLEVRITESLHELNMQHSRFGVSIENAQLSATGADSVQFMISTASKEPLKPLTKIASGGELSRTMLALKSIISDDIDTLIFDEIDTGVSGITAKKIAEKLYRISQTKQVLCVTHLPQLASMADHHYLITKTSDDDGAKTYVSELSRSERTDELARLTGGDITEASRVHANELLSISESFKNSQKGGGGMS